MEVDDKKYHNYEMEEILNKKLGTDMNYRHTYFWPTVLFLTVLHISSLVGLYAAIFYAKWATLLWVLFITFCMIQSIGLGAHRFYSHRSFKAKMAVKIFFLFFQTMSGQNSMLIWVRYHRLHHKYVDTDADPHNAARGFFFSHIGWLMVNKHPLLKEKQKQIDISDLLVDKMIMFQYKYFAYLYFVTAIFFRIFVPIYFWNETLWSSFFVAYSLSYTLIFNVTWSINSSAHLWGNKPYDKRLMATQSAILWFVTLGEGWHNFHHAFPWDSRQSEFDQIPSVNTWTLDLLAYLGLVYDLKKVSPNIVFEHMKKYGDETRQKILAAEKYIKTQEINGQPKNISAK